MWRAIRSVSRDVSATDLQVVVGDRSGAILMSHACGQGAAVPLASMSPNRDISIYNRYTIDIDLPHMKYIIPFYRLC